MDGNGYGSLVQALSNALDRKARGNTLFIECKYKKAVGEYRKALLLVSSFVSTLNPDITSLMVTLRSNLAACYLKMEQYEQAVDEAQAAVVLDPLHLKSYSRLCEAQHSFKLVPDAAASMIVVVALTLLGRLEDVMVPIFNDLVGRLMLPPEIGDFACAASDRELQHALSAQKPFVVLKPGNYTVAWDLCNWNIP